MMGWKQGLDCAAHGPRPPKCGEGTWVGGRAWGRPGMPETLGWRDPVLSLMDTKGGTNPPGDTVQKRT